MVVQLLVLVQLLHLCQTELVRRRDAGHRHVGTVHDEDEDGEKTEQSAHHAETEDDATAHVQLLHDVTTQEGSSTACWYHHVS